MKSRKKGGFSISGMRLNLQYLTLCVETGTHYSSGMFMTKITKNSIWCGGRITAIKKLSSGNYGCICTCGKKHKMTKNQLAAAEFPCTCGSPEKHPVVVVSADPDRGAKLTKLQERMKRLNSVFKDEVSTIQRLLEAHNSDGAITVFQKTALATMIELIPIAEEKYRKFGNERSAYALNSLITQARELVGDIKAEQDQRELALRLSREIVNPAFIQIMQNMVDNLYQLKRNVESCVPTNRVSDVHRQVEQTAREITHFLEQSYAQIRDRITSEMTDI